MEKGEYLDLDPLIPAKVGMVQSGMPASEIGLQRADEIILLDSVRINSWQKMTEVIRAYPEDNLNIVWLRKGDTLRDVIRPRAFEEKGENDSTVIVGKIGIGYYYEHKDIGLGRALVVGVKNTFDLIALNAKGLWWVISGVKSAKEVVGGPVMIAKMAGEAAAAGWTQLLYLIAALSAILAFFNILPIPALDGGHLIFLIIEGIIGRPVPIKVKIKVQQVGMAILLALIIFIFYVDIKRLLF
jgi:regulator of sigma E protease